MQSMKGATMLLGSMNRQMNLPALQRIAMEFERENDVMDQRQEMMDDAIDEATGMEGEEEEGEDILKEVLDEIGVDLNQAVCSPGLQTSEGGPCRLTFSIYSLVTHLNTYRKHQSMKLESRRPLEGEEIRVMMTSKQDWTASGDDYDFLSYMRLITEVIMRPAVLSFN